MPQVSTERIPPGRRALVFVSELTGGSLEAVCEAGKLSSPLVARLDHSTVVDTPQPSSTNARPWAETPKPRDGLSVWPPVDPSTAGGSPMSTRSNARPVAPVA